MTSGIGHTSKKAPPLPEILKVDPYDRIATTVVSALVDSTLGFGLSDAHLHIAEADSPKVIVDIWSDQLLKKRSHEFLKKLRSKGIEAEIRHNPTLDVPVDANLHADSTTWVGKPISVDLSQALLERRILIKQDAKFEKRGRNITINPQLVRTWIKSELPGSIDVRAIDFPEVRKNQRRSQRTIALITCTVPVEDREKLQTVLDRFELRFGIEVALNPVPKKQGLHYTFTEDGDSLSRWRVFAKEDVPKLKKTLQTTLRWRHAPQGRTQDMTDLAWFGIDASGVVLREDLIHVHQKKGTLRVLVAIPDITVQDGIPNLSASREANGAFYLGQETNAWVVELRLRRGKWRHVSAPFRARVRSMRECEGSDTFLQHNEAYQSLKSELGCSSDYAVIEKLMHKFGTAVGAFLRRESTSFLVRKENSKSVAILKKMLVAEGIKVKPHSFDSKAGILKAMKRAQREGKYNLLPLLAAQLTGATVVCRSDGGECGIKPQKGTRELLNQWILASVIDGWNNQLPEFLQEILRQPVIVKDAGSALAAYESERHYARMISMIIGVLSDSSKTRTARVVHLEGKDTHCWIPALKQYGIVRDMHVAEQSRIKLRVTAYDARRSRFVCEIAPPQEALIDPMSINA